MRELQPGVIFDIATDAGILLKGKGKKRTCRCPFHDDKTPSAFLSVRNIFGCAVCTAGDGWPAKQFCQKLGLDWSSYLTSSVRTSAHRVALNPEPTFTPTQAAAVSKLAFARARDDQAVDEEREVYDFLASRGLMESTEYGVFGVLSAEMALPIGVASWPKRGYSLLAPLYDHTGNIVSLQSRSVRGGDPKTLAPSGGRVAGTVFADERGLAVLRGRLAVTEPVIFAEGLTDYLALAVASPVAVLSVPGTSNAEKGAGAWARKRTVILALDCDDAGRARVDPTAAAMRTHGASRVLTLTWPAGCKDACDVVAQRGTDGLHAILVNKVARVST